MSDRLRLAIALILLALLFSLALAERVAESQELPPCPRVPEWTATNAACIPTEPIVVDAEPAEPTPSEPEYTG